MKSLYAIGSAALAAKSVALSINGWYDPMPADAKLNACSCCGSKAAICCVGICKPAY